MNNFKNFVIVILSAIIIVQSAFLIYLLKRPAAPARKATARPLVKAVPPKRLAEPAPAVQKMPVKPMPKKASGKIAIVLDDWGYNLKNMDFITDNDFRLTLSVLPFKTFSTEVAELAHEHNKDVIIHMPMEPHNKENYGLEENTLLTTMDKGTLLKLIDRASVSVPFSKGMSNHMGSKATENPRLMMVIFGYLKQKGMFFLDSFVTPRTVCRKLSQKMDVAFAERDVFIDNESTPSYIRAQLLELAEKARRKGRAVGIGHDRVNTIAVLKEVIPEFEAEGYEFVNLSELIKKSD